MHSVGKHMNDTHSMKTLSISVESPKELCWGGLSVFRHRVNNDMLVMYLFSISFYGLIKPSSMKELLIKQEACTQFGLTDRLKMI